MQVRTLDWSDWLTIGALAVLAFIALVYIPFGWIGISEAMSAPNTAAWVQAIGSIGAILTVIWVSSREADRRARERDKHELEGRVQVLTKLGKTLLTIYWSLNAMKIEVNRDGSHGATERYLRSQRKALEDLDTFVLPSVEAPMYVCDVLVSLSYVLATLDRANSGAVPGGMKHQIANDVSIAMLNTAEAVLGVRAIVEQYGGPQEEWEFGRDEFKVSSSSLS